jgi:aspartate racemase
MKKLGVLGGMGPAASAEFYRRLTDQTPATCDQEHIPCVIWSDPTVPDRSTSLINRDDLPWEKLKQGILGLKNAGCDHIVIPCNTAHFWYDKMSTLGVPITHIVGSVAEELRALKIYSGTIGIIGTKATMRMGLYQNYLGKLGWSCITPETYEMDNLIQPAIDLVKSGDIGTAHNMLLKAIDKLIPWGVDAVVLGCTEIPLAIVETHHKNIPLINSIDSLVKAAIKEYGVVTDQLR